MDFEANAQNEEVQSIILKKFDHMPTSMSTTIYVNKNVKYKVSITPLMLDKYGASKNILPAYSLM